MFYLLSSTIFLCSSLCSFRLFTLNSTYSSGCTSSSLCSLSLHPPSPWLFVWRIIHWVQTEKVFLVSPGWIIHCFLASFGPVGLLLGGLLTGGEPLTKNKNLINPEALEIRRFFSSFSLPCKKLFLEYVSLIGKPLALGMKNAYNWLLVRLKSKCPYHIKCWFQLHQTRTLSSWC